MQPIWPDVSLSEIDSLAWTRQIGCQWQPGMEWPRKEVSSVKKLPRMEGPKIGLFKTFCLMMPLMMNGWAGESGTIECDDFLAFVWWTRRLAYEVIYESPTSSSQSASFLEWIPCHSVPSLILGTDSKSIDFFKRELFCHPESIYPGLGTNTHNIFRNR